MIENSAIMDRSVVGDNAEIRDSIIARHVIIDSSQAEKTRVIEVSVIAGDVFVEAGCEVVSIKIYPHRYVHRQSFYNQ